MKARKKLLLLISLLILLNSVVFTQEKDVAESKDHPLLSRMQNFYISSYKKYSYDSHEFYDAQDNEYVIEGQKWVIEYTLKEGFDPPGQLKVRKNHINAIRNIGGTILFDQGVYMKVSQGDKEIWIDVWVDSDGSDYRLTIVEEAVMRQEVVADPEALAEDIKKAEKDASLPSETKTAKPELARQSMQKKKGMKDPDIQRIEQALAKAKRNRKKARANLNGIWRIANKRIATALTDCTLIAPPPPAGPIPIPYPNIAKTSDTSKGSKKVKMNAAQAEAMLKGSNYKKSESDEVGTKVEGLTELIQSRNEKGNLTDKDKVSLKNELMMYQEQAVSIARALDEYVEDIERLLEESKKELGIK
jgi:hypothetical protein